MQNTERVILYGPPVILFSLVVLITCTCKNGKLCLVFFQSTFFPCAFNIFQRLILAQRDLNKKNNSERKENEHVSI